ncbi:MAG: 3'-5' exonuclease [Chitinophagales bacterium]|nr:3'-5' exonuclease [Chitinophagales bacterium]
MHLNLKKPICTFDIETTGIDIVNDRIVEIAAVKVFPDQRKEEISYRLNPTIPISKESTEIHGITNEDVKDEKQFKDIAKELYEFMIDCDLCGFNLRRLDIPILVEEFLRVDLIFNLDDRKIIDVQRIFHMMERRDLTAAYKFYCDKELDAHKSSEDANATYEILESQIDRYDEIENDVNFLDNLTKDKDFIDTGRRLVNIDGKPAFNFGKYRGKYVEDVFEKDPSYYGWIMNNQFPLHTKHKLKEIKLSLKHSN